MSRKWLLLVNSEISQIRENSNSLNKNCIVPNCLLPSVGVKVSLFSVPQNSFLRWKQPIPNVKFSSKSRVCSQQECDMKKGEYVLDDFYPYSRWRLTSGAEPKHFLGKLLFKML